MHGVGVGKTRLPDNPCNRYTLRIMKCFCNTCGLTATQAGVVLVAFPEAFACHKTGTLGTQVILEEGKPMFCEDEETVDTFETGAEPDVCLVEERPSDHILVIDDDESQVTVLSHSLMSLGYRVSVASNCDDGIRMAYADRPDLVLLDIKLPDGDGLEVCSKFNDDPETADVPVIIVSGADQPDIVRKARSAGCHYFVRKPYDPNALLILAQNAIGESRDW